MTLNNQKFFQNLFKMTTRWVIEVFYPAYSRFHMHWFSCFIWTTVHLTDQFQKFLSNSNLFMYHIQYCWRYESNSEMLSMWYISCYYLCFILGFLEDPREQTERNISFCTLFTSIPHQFIPVKIIYFRCSETFQKSIWWFANDVRAPHIGRSRRHDTIHDMTWLLPKLCFWVRYQCQGT